MKTSFRSLLAVALICVTIIIPVASFAAPELPKTKFSPELVDGVGKWYLNFETNPGYHYIVEESQNLVDWTAANGGSFYGNGVEQKMFICNGPMSTESTGTGGTPNSGEGLWQLKTITMKLQMQSGNNGAFQRVSRNSYTPLGATEALPAWDKELTLQLPSQTARWRYFPMLEWKDYTEHIMYWVDLHVHITDDPPPVDSLTTSAEEPAELEIFSKVYSALVGQLLLEGTPAPPSGPQPRTYARIRVTEIDVNGNGLWDWWELKYGWNPFANPGQPGFCDPYGDPDGDGIPNYQEKIDGTDPTKFDSDGDGFHDGEDDFPNDKEKHPPPVTYLIVASKGLSFKPSSGGPLYGFELTKWDDWTPTSVTSYPPSSPYTSPDAMVGGLAAPDFPQNIEGIAPKGAIPENGWAEASGEFTFAPGADGMPSFYSGDLKHASVWLVHKPIEKTPVTESFLVLQKKTSTVGPTSYEPSLEVVTLEVKKDKIYSEPYDLLPDFSGVSGSSQSFTVTTKTELRQIEFVQPELDEFDRRILDAEGKDKLVPVDRLRLCRWYQAFGWRKAQGVAPSNFQQDFHKKDNDRFHIRVSGKDPGPKIKIQTSGLSDVQKWDENAWVPVTEDNEDEIAMTKPDPTKDVWLSEPMILVDGDDDVTYKPRGENEENDVTHAAGLDSTVKVKIPAWNNLEAVKKTVQARYEIQVRNLVLSPAPIVAAQTADIENSYQLARDAYRPHTLTIKHSGLPLYQNAEITSLIQEVGDKTVLNLDLEAKMEKFGKALKDSGATPETVTVVWLADVNTIKPPSYMSNHATGITGLYISEKKTYHWIAIPMREFYTTTFAHELGHTFGLTHVVEGNVKHTLMASLPTPQFLDHYYLTERKRFYFDEQDATERGSNEGMSMLFDAKTLPHCKKLP